MGRLFHIDNCSVKIDGKTILTPLTLDILKGDFVTITGASGSGKSTLLQLLLGFREPSQGKISYLEVPIKGSQLSKLREDVAVVFQEPPLSGTTVEEVLLLPFSYKCNKKNHPDTEEVVRTLKSVGLSEALLKQSPSNLSGGEKQRIALVRALLLNRPILILDEISSALDAQNRDTIHRLLSSPKRTVIVVSHDKEWIEKSAKVVTLEGADDANR